MMEYITLSDGMYICTKSSRSTLVKFCNIDLQSLHYDTPQIPHEKLYDTDNSYYYNSYRDRLDPMRYVSDCIAKCKGGHISLDYYYAMHSNVKAHYNYVRKILLRAESLKIYDNPDINITADYDFYCDADMLRCLVLMGCTMFRHFDNMPVYISTLSYYMYSTFGIYNTNGTNYKPNSRCIDYLPPYLEILVTDLIVAIEYSGIRTSNITYKFALHISYIDNINYRLKQLVYMIMPN